MSYLVTFPVEGGGTLAVEVDEGVQAGVVRASRPGEIVAEAQQTLESALDRVMPAAQAMIGRVRALSAKPDEVQVAFGVKLSAEAGAILAKAGGEANLTVTLKWNSA